MHAGAEASMTVWSRKTEKGGVLVRSEGIRQAVRREQFKRRTRKRIRKRPADVQGKRDAGMS